MLEKRMLRSIECMKLKPMEVFYGISLSSKVFYSLCRGFLFSFSAWKGWVGFYSTKEMDHTLRVKGGTGRMEEPEQLILASPWGFYIPNIAAE